MASPRRSSFRWLFIIAAVIAFAGVIAALRLLSPTLTPPVPDAISVVHETPMSTRDQVVPPASESDARIRGLLQSALGRARSWLGQTDLLRRAVVATVNIAEDVSPREPLDFAKPKRSFVARPSMEPRAYARYGFFANAIASINSGSVAQAVRVLTPWLDAAYHRLGYPGRSFGETLVAALERIERAPVIEGDIELHPEGAFYQFVDPRLEALGPVEKHLLRMGPRNTRLIQHKAHEFKIALATSIAAAN